MSPLYEYRCPKDGVWESINSGENTLPCPECGKSCKRIFSIPAKARVTYKENLPLGNKSRGRFIPPKDGRAGILIPSYGLLEKEEIDYIAEANIEKEEKRKRDNPQKENLNNLINYARTVKPGKRDEAIRQVLKEG